MRPKRAAPATTTPDHSDADRDAAPSTTCSRGSRPRHLGGRRRERPPTRPSVPDAAAALPQGSEDAGAPGRPRRRGRGGARGRSVSLRLQGSERGDAHPDPDGPAFGEGHDLPAAPARRGAARAARDGVRSRRRACRRWSSLFVLDQPASRHGPSSSTSFWLWDATLLARSNDFSADQTPDAALRLGVRVARGGAPDSGRPPGRNRLGLPDDDGGAPAGFGARAGSTSPSVRRSPTWR